jgi:D-3-phosphoglycerate dehydrogenase / 2-oxoglutarate reductase
MSPETLELLSWVSRQPRSYPEAIEVWRTSCPQHSIWEDALGAGLVEVVRNGSDFHVKLTPHGAAALRRYVTNE